MLVIVADDHALFREGLRLQLQELGEDIEVLEAGDFKRALELVNERSGVVDLVLLDLDMPGMDWRQAIDELVSRSDSVSVVVISATGDPEIIEEALAKGAVGFIPKDCSGKVMLGALKLVLSGGTYVPPAMLANWHRPNPFTRRAAAWENSSGSRHTLTRRQMDVLSRLAVGQSNKEIARDLGLAEGTVKLHVTSILKSFGVSNRTQAVVAAQQAGILAGERPSH